MGRCKNGAAIRPAGRSAAAQKTLRRFLDDAPSDNDLDVWRHANVPRFRRQFRASVRLPRQKTAIDRLIRTSPMQLITVDGRMWSLMREPKAPLKSASYQ